MTPEGTVTLGHQHGLRLQPKSGTPTWPSVVTWAMDITQILAAVRSWLQKDLGPRYDPQQQHGSRYGHGLRCQSRPLSVLSCLQVCLSPQHSASLSHYLSTTDLLATVVPTCLSPTCTGMWQANLLNGDVFSIALLRYQRFGKGWWGWSISY